MPRHNLKKYQPELDSTLSLLKEARDKKVVCLNTKTRKVEEGAKVPKGTRAAGCPCGCEGEPVGGKRIFLMGHDARLRGKLIRAHLTGTPIIRYVDGNPSKPHSAMLDAKAFGDSFVNALKEAEARRHQANKDLLQKALRSERLIKVGRWEFTGQVVAVFEGKGRQSKDQYEIRYVDRQGKTKTAKVPADKAPLATKADKERIAKVDPKGNAKGAKSSASSENGSDSTAADTGGNGADVKVEETAEAAA